MSSRADLDRDGAIAEAELELAGGAGRGGRGERLTQAVVHGCVTPRQGARRIVSGQREPQAIELSAPAGGVRSVGADRCAGEYQPVGVSPRAALLGGAT